MVVPLVMGRSPARRFRKRSLAPGAGAGRGPPLPRLPPRPPPLFRRPLRPPGPPSRYPPPRPHPLAIPRPPSGGRLPPGLSGPSGPPAPPPHRAPFPPMGPPRMRPFFPAVTRFGPMMPGLGARPQGVRCVGPKRFLNSIRRPPKRPAPAQPPQRGPAPERPAEDSPPFQINPESSAPRGDRDDFAEDTLL